MTLLYWIGIRGYFLTIRLAAFLGNAQASKWVNGRRTAPPLPPELFVNKDGSPGRAPLIWMHCASLGEWEQGRPVLLAFLRQYPDYRALLTFFSPSGYEPCHTETAVDHVAYLPADAPATARRWVSELQPQVAVFVKYEFWYFYLQALQRAAVPTFLVAANFRPNQHFFRWYGRWGRRLLRYFTGIAVQQPAVADLLAGAGAYPADRIAICGDPRMDRTRELVAQPFTDERVAAFTAGRLTIIAGSVWPADMEALAAAWPALPEEVCLLLAPHQLVAAELARTQVRWKAERYTQTTPAAAAGSRVLLLDTMGLLSRVYRYGSIAYVGGAFRTGLHNTLEPLAYGLPVIFGPEHHKFPEAAAALASGGAWSIASDEELRAVLCRLLDPASRARAAAAQRALSAAMAGATERTVAFINDKMSELSES